jgi:hypothetical protein
VKATDLQELGHTSGWTSTGVLVSSTPLFSRTQYLTTADGYMRGIER